MAQYLKSFYVFVLIIPVFLPSCNSNTKKVSSEKEQDKVKNQVTAYRTLHIGSGGGFTGAITKYTILPDGKVMKIHTLNEKEPSYYKTLSENEMKQTHERLKRLDFENIQFNAPGNMYYFITMEYDETEHTVKWGDHRKKVPSQVQEYYDFAMQILKKTADR